MPHMETIRNSLAELASGPPLVVALAGGTTGIGAYVAKALASAFAKNGTKLRVYIVGRNATRAATVIAESQRISPASEWRFVQATDLALISEVDRCCAEIIQQETEAPFHGGPIRLDLLYMTHGYPVLKERTTTREGLDAFISIVYYSRIRFITQLLPLLTASPKSGHVISVYAGTFEDGTKPGDSPIGCPPPSIYGVTSVRKHTSFMKTFMFEEFADKHAGKLSLTHIYPGLVDGPGFTSPEMPLWFRAVWRLLKPLSKLYMTSADDCGDVLLYLATARYPAKDTMKNSQVLVGGLEVARSSNGEVGGGCYTVGQRADATNKVSYEKVRSAETGKQVWDHTMDILNGVEAANSAAAR
ncbi:hypothetical protein QQS21_002336 [Conoideocrella luteorostrata]|uniref:Uncharacterized protein n=1 Tax=Conoideocrella luteorostrata TaxID=1105319 RepID=A0AAJ0G1E1_9HYPO|nr:hypothetical protein QQS21_002336 [Conoideocrella luteorostrata]